MQFDHVLIEPEQHLRCNLATDTAVHIGLAGKEFAALAPPEVRNRIAHEHDTISLGVLRRNSDVLIAVASQIAIVAQALPHTLNLSLEYIWIGVLWNRAQGRHLSEQRPFAAKDGNGQAFHRLPQKEYFNANCRIRGSFAARRTPKFWLLRVPLG